MNMMRTLVCTVALGASSNVLALQAEQHQSHHPESAASAAPKSTAQPAPPAEHADHQAGSEAPAMDAQLDAMHAMHARMMAAKDPAERKALMAEHDKLMHEGMRMMEAMSHKEGGGGGCDMGGHERHMAMHMEMMQAMMQLMMDRLPDDTRK
jgi:hypothetical protein